MSGRLGLLIALVALAACQDMPPASPVAPAPSASVAGDPDLIPGRFIVTLREGENPGTVAADYGVTPRYLYRSALNGFAGSISDAARAGLLRDARVVRVEQDRVMRAFGTQSPAPSWGLDRVDQHLLPLNNSYTYNYTGSGVTAYIIDTGIDVGNADFGNRARVGVDEVGDGQNGKDCNGHGTHVSGTVGGTTYGIAKGVTLVAVRVLDCNGSGTTSGVAAGVDWVTSTHASPAVANMSLGGGASSTLDNAVANSISSGVAYAIAAGNGNFAGIAQDACNYSPARVPAAMTIGATNSSDAKASWSNYGSCVDWFAPGVSIKSDWLNGGTNTISGTSMATPHTTGVAALVLEASPTLTAAQVRDQIFASLTLGVVTSSSTANNHLLYSLVGGGAPPTAGAPTGLSARVSTRGTTKVNLTWSGGAATVDVIREDGTLAAGVTNSGSYTDNLGKRPAPGQHTYTVCNAGTNGCSNSVTASF